jgi:hypothetical protein
MPPPARLVENVKAKARIGRKHLMAREKAQKLVVSVIPLIVLPIEQPVLLDGKQEI